MFRSIFTTIFRGLIRFHQDRKSRHTQTRRLQLEPSPVGVSRLTDGIHKDDRMLYELPTLFRPFFSVLTADPHYVLTHFGRVTQICVFTLQLCRTGDADLRF